MDDDQERKGVPIVPPPQVGSVAEAEGQAAQEAKQREAKIEDPARIEARKIKRTQSVQGIAKQMDTVIKDAGEVQQTLNIMADVIIKPRHGGIVPQIQYREEQIRRLENLQKINTALGDLTTSALVTRSVGAVEHSVLNFEPVRADPATQQDIVERIAYDLNSLGQEAATNPVLQRHPSLQKALQKLIGGLTQRDAVVTELQQETNMFIRQYLEDPIVPLVEKAVAGPIVISLRDILTHIHQDSIPRIIAVSRAFNRGAVTIQEAREMLAAEYGYSMLIPQGIKAVCDGFESCKQGTFSAFKWGGRLIKTGFQNMNIFNTINFRAKFNTYKNTKDFLSTIFSLQVVQTILPEWLDVASYSFFKYGTLCLIGCAVIKYLLSFFYELKDDTEPNQEALLERVHKGLETELLPEITSEQNSILRDAITGSVQANEELARMVGVSITEETRALERTGANPRSNYKAGLPEGQGRSRRASALVERGADARRIRQDRGRAASVMELVPLAPVAEGAEPRPARLPRSRAPGAEGSLNSAMFGTAPRPQQGGPQGFSRGKLRYKSKRKSTRKSTRKSARKSTRKPVCKSKRKSTRKSARKTTRKSARKSTRKPVCKSKRKSTRKSKK